MLQNPPFSALVAAVVRRLTSGVTTAATTKPKPLGSAYDRPCGRAHGHRQASGYQTHGE